MPPGKKPPAIDKAALKAELVAHLARALDQARAAHASAVEGATHEEARPENDKDTRGLEQSYLARGQAQRVAELEAAVADATALALRTFTPRDPVGMGAAVTVDEDGDERVYFVAPHGGGTVLAGGVQVVTPSSPLGRALSGKRVDDEAEVDLRGKKRSLAIVALA
ncbi:MAG: GreA/GreB family elongation factor [Deltaproteobacteria bacterium]|nr:GreA/GreB family elongation factor [Deltaproteobacteria bacterium]